MKYYAIQQTERAAEIYIFGDLTSWRWTESDTSAWSLAQEIKDLDVDVIHVHIDSYGGEVSEGWAIYNTLRQHKAKVITHADGFVASAAIYPFMAGDQRIASSMSAFFFHQVELSVHGNADGLKKAAEDAQMFNDLGLEAMKNAGVDADQILALEKNATWLTPQQALELKIATEIRTHADGNTPSQSIRNTILQRLMQPQPAQTPEPKPQEPAPCNRLRAFLQGVKF